MSDTVASASAWGGVEDNIDDDEEMRVIFCALDSFSYVLRTTFDIMAFLVLTIPVQQTVCKISTF